MMCTKVRVGRALALAAILWVGAPGWAQAQSPSPLSKAKALKKEAFRNFADGKYADGIQALKDAHGLVPHADFLLNIGIAYDMWTGHCIEALDYLNRFVDACGACTNRRLADEKTRKIREKCEAPLKIETAPAGAMIELDGKEVGKTPAELRALPGAHSLALSLDGYTPHRETFSLESQKPKWVTVTLKTVAQSGWVFLDNLAPGAAVTVDGRPTNTDLAKPIELGAGAHEVTVLLRGSPPSSYDVKVEPNKTIVLNVAPLEPPPSRPKPEIDLETTRPHSLAGSNLGVWAWTGVGVGVVGVGAGIAFTARMLSGISEEETATEPPYRPKNEVDEIRDGARRDAVLAYVGYGIGAVGLVAAGLLFLMDGDEDAVTIVPSASGTSAQLTVVF